MKFFHIITQLLGCFFGILWNSCLVMGGLCVANTSHILTNISTAQLPLRRKTNNDHNFTIFQVGSSLIIVRKTRFRTRYNSSYVRMSKWGSLSTLQCFLNSNIFIVLETGNLDEMARSWLISPRCIFKSYWDVHLQATNHQCGSTQRI